MTHFHSGSTTDLLYYDSFNSVLWHQLILYFISFAYSSVPTNFAQNHSWWTFWLHVVNNRRHLNPTKHWNVNLKRKCEINFWIFFYLSFHHFPYWIFYNIYKYIKIETEQNFHYLNYQYLGIIKSSCYHASSKLILFIISIFFVVFCLLQ